MKSYLATEEKLAAYIEGDLSEEERMLIEEQLGKSEEMRESLSDLRKTVQHLRSIEEVEPPSLFTQIVMSKIREEAAARNRKKGVFERLFGSLSVKPLVHAFAAVFLVLLSFIIYTVYKPETDRVRSVGSGISEEDQTGTAWGDVRIVLGADDIEEAGGEVQAAVYELGGVVLKKQFFSDKEVLFAGLDSEQLDELYEKLKPIGKLKEQAGLSGLEGRITIKVEVVKK